MRSQRLVIVVSVMTEIFCIENTTETVDGLKSEFLYSMSIRFLILYDYQNTIIMLLLVVIFYFGILFLIIGSIWRVFEKAGQPGWACLIPFYNYYIMAKIGGVKNWWLIFIPIANIYIIFVIMIALAKSFGKDTGFGVALVFLGIIFFPILGFGDAQYIGPNGEHLQKEIDQIGK